MITTKQLAFGLLGLAMLAGCDEDDDSQPIVSPEKVIVQFGQHMTITENTDPLDISLDFSRATVIDGVIVIQIESDFMDDFVITPPAEDGEITLEVNAGVTIQTIGFKPINNESLDGMKQVKFTISSVSEGFLVGSNTSLDITITDDESPVFVNMARVIDSIMENETEAHRILLSFSAPVKASSKIIVQQSGDTDFLITQPSSNSQGLIEIPVSPGMNEAWITVTPQNDLILKGHKNIAFSITGVEGELQKGEQISNTLKVIDDELRGKPNYYESFGDNWRIKESYEYDETGRIYKINWERATPGLLSGNYTYYYGDNNIVERVNHYAGKDEFFYQENGRIVRSEIIDNGEKTSYSLYDYDAQGNVGGKAVYYKQESGEYIMSLIYVYIHYANGNLFKQLVYTPGSIEGEETLISTRTYEEYTTIDNPFHFVDLLPNNNSQRQWPATYSIDENGFNLSYRFDYTVNSSGMPVKRLVASSNEITYYFYH